ALIALGSFSTTSVSSCRSPPTSCALYSTARCRGRVLWRSPESSAADTSRPKRSTWDSSQSPTRRPTPARAWPSLAGPAQTPLNSASTSSPPSAAASLISRHPSAASSPASCSTGTVDFAAFRKAVKGAFRDDIPVRERGQWEAYLGENAARMRELSDRIAAAEREIDQ